MKRTVLSMAEENYDYSVHDGEITFSTDRIEFVFVSDEEREGSFEVFCGCDTPMLGVCHSNNPRMKVKNPQFRGNDAEIGFVFDSAGMEPGDVAKGEFIFLTNKGEFNLPFACVREADYINSTLGHIKNLFHFANLAKTNWTEAVNVFYSNSFVSLLTGTDSSYRNLYRGLSENVLNEQNMDEFLVAVKKKDRISYSVDTSEIYVSHANEEIVKTVKVTKSGWGFVCVDVASDGNFLYLPKTHFDYEDFEGDELNIDVRIVPDFMNVGRNFGKVKVTTANGTEEIIVRADKKRIDVTKLENFMFRDTLSKLLRLYLDFSFDRITEEEWCKTSMDLAEKINGTKEHNLLGKLFQAQILIVSKRREDAEWIIKQLGDNVENEKYSEETIGYYLYITCLLSRESDVVGRSLKKIKKFYSKKPGNSILSWLILYLTEEFYQKSERKLEFLIEQYRLGNNSPLLFVEGLNILNSDPSLLMKLDDYSESVLRFGLKYKAISANLGERIQFLVSREKDFKNIWFDILKYQYAYTPSKELLNCIVSYLCKGNKIGKEYFEWYRLGIEAELRITRLYEIFMDSLPASYDSDLPQMVMMYFAYQNNLDYKKKAFLYKNVLTRRTKYPEIAMSYRETLEDFAKTQIRAHNINDDLLYIYAKVLNPSFVEKDIANECVTLQFMRRVIVPDGYDKVILIHEKIVGEQVYVPDNRVVFCPIYSKNYRIFYEDKDGNRTVVPEDNISEPVLMNPMLLDKISHLVSDKIGLIMCRVEGEYNDNYVTEDNVFDYERMLHSDIVTYTYKKTIIKNLLIYYFENDYITELEEILETVKPEIFEGDEKGKFIQILIARGMYDTAFKILNTFGPEHVEAKAMLRLVSRLLERTDFEETEDMIAYAQYVYRQGKYDANILLYLGQNFQGNTNELKSLYSDSEAFGIDTFMLLENILIQVLFTNTYCKERNRFLDTYISNNGSKGIEKAFLSRSAYDYFVGDVVTDDMIFDKIEKNILEDEEMNRISKLALLKFYSTEEKERWNKKIINTLVNEELDRRVCFPFFMTFENIVSNLQSYSDFSFVEYKGNPSGQVVIHYCIEHDDGMATEYKKEQMNHLYNGIFVKPFILFCGDTVQYYITEENQNMEQLTQSSVLTKSESDIVSKPWRYTSLNDLIVAKQMSDYVTVENDILSYMEKDYLTKQLFKVL